MLKGPEFITQYLTWLVLEGIGIDCIEDDSLLCSQFDDGLCICRGIPGYMQGNSPAGLIERMKKANVFYFLPEGTRFSTFSPETAKPCPSGSQGPAWNGHLKTYELADELIRMSHSGNGLVISPLVLIHLFLIAGFNFFPGYHHEGFFIFFKKIGLWQMEHFFQWNDNW
jgi:hypothetical protein